MSEVLLSGGKVYTDKGFLRRGISVYGNGISNSVFIADNLYIVPGFTDVHTHLREPGFFYKESIKTGTQAAARGGYTAICAMPNLNPVPDCVENLKLQQDIIDRDAVIAVYPYASITKGRQGGGEIVDFAALKDRVIAFSDDGCGVQDADTMLEAMVQAKKYNKIIAAHCEVNSLLHGGYIHNGKYAKEHNHKGISSESEYAQIARDIELAAKSGCKYHVCHISTKESVELVRKAKKDGVDITCETAPHYLVLCEDDIQEDGRYKMNPPLRSKRDKEALIEGICDATIDMIATDHAPHSAEEKSRGLEKSAMGIVGLETSFPILYTHLVKSGIISLERLVELMSVNPRKRFDIKGGIENGDFAVLNLECEYKVNSSTFLSKGRATPFDGANVYSKNVMTVYNGRIVWQEEK